ncbi:hypothetical protein MKY95_19325 [Paenibacillus sp. FSL P4-0176]|uniref:hypothetical protein n=1 Tax=Paenibacillus sp. FSL P4-0176 TaxID=2921631 RepID=UPI0030CD200C
MTNDQTKYPDFYEAADELDDLVRDGILGEEAIRNLERRDSLNMEEYLVHIFDHWMGDKDQIGKDNVKDLIRQFIDFFVEAVQKQPQDTFDILSEYWRGTQDNPELEGMSGYTEAVRFHREAINGIYQIQGQNNKSSDIKRVAGAYITAYSKWVEYVGQLLFPCIKIALLINEKQINENQIFRMTLNNKIDFFNSETDNKYFALNDLINRTIRNADSHLSIKYSYSKNSLEYKKRSQGKTRVFTVPIAEWITETYPKPGWFVQAFIMSTILAYLGTTNTELFRVKYESLFS